MNWKEIQRITIKVKALGYDVDNMTLTEILKISDEFCKKHFNKEEK